MNFLQIVQRLRQECGVSGSGPLSVVGQTGESKRLVDWAADAWLEIQGLHDHWGFLRKQFAFDTVASLGDYTPTGAAGTGAALTDFKQWHTETFRCYIKANGVSDEQWLVEWDYQTFRNTYRYALQVNGRPVVFAIKSADKAVMLGAIPDRAYTVVGEYQAVPTALALDADTPAILPHLHMVIVYKAMMSYGLYEAAPEVIQRAEVQYRRLMNQMERQYLPPIVLGNPLA